MSSQLAFQKLKMTPLYTKIRGNIKMAKLKITITIADEWEDDVVIKF
jgi:hypothetical protein